jgi:hypothetical protein
MPLEAENSDGIFYKWQFSLAVQFEKSRALCLQGGSTSMVKWANFLRDSPTRFLWVCGCIKFPDQDDKFSCSGLKGFSRSIAAEQLLLPKQQGSKHNVYRTVSL